MGLLASWRQRRRAGLPYDGPAAWCDDYEAVPRPGYYALSPDGKTLLPKVPLVCVDDAPGNHLNGACHYEYAGPRDNPQRRATGEPVPKGRPVELEANPEGSAEVNA